MSVGKGIRFRCRAGHVYSVRELIVQKEQRLENVLWAPVTALEELAALLRDLIALGEAGSLAGAYEERAARALRNVEAVKTVIEDNVATLLEVDATGEP
jgi:two-component system chemotaxis response regulator CheB